MVSRKANSSSPGSDTRDDPRRERRDKQRVKPPLDEAALRDLALSYAARFATTAARVEAYLARKVKERGVAEDADGRMMQIDIPALVLRLVELGYVDDDAYARMRARDLGARGYGGRRVEQVLWAAGIDEGLRAAHAPGEGASRKAAALMAQKKRLGPWAAPSGFGREVSGDPMTRRKTHEKAVAAMLRAGHQYDHVRFILAAGRAEDVDEWLDEAADEEEADRW